ENAVIDVDGTTPAAEDACRHVAWPDNRAPTVVLVSQLSAVVRVAAHAARRIDAESQEKLVAAPDRLLAFLGLQIRRFNGVFGHRDRLAIRVHPLRDEIAQGF